MSKPKKKKKPTKAQLICTIMTELENTYISGNSMSFIWDLVFKALNSYSKRTLTTLIKLNEKDE